MIKNFRCDYTQFVIYILKFKDPNMNKELNYAQICIASLTKTLPEKFHPFWTYDPPQIKDCQQAEIL